MLQETSFDEGVPVAGAPPSHGIEHAGGDASGTIEPLTHVEVVVPSSPTGSSDSGDMAAANTLRSPTALNAAVAAANAGSSGAAAAGASATPFSSFPSSSQPQHATSASSALSSAATSPPPYTADDNATERAQQGDAWSGLRLDLPEDSAAVRHVAEDLFDPRNHGARYQRIEGLVAEAQKTEMDQYMMQFAQEIENEVLIVGSLPLEDVVEEQQRTRDQGLARVAVEREVLHQFRERLNHVVEKAREKLSLLHRARAEQLRAEAAHIRHDEMLHRDALAKAFRAAETQLVDALKKRHGEVQTLYGDLVLADGVYAGNRGRRWRVDWDRTPQPIQIKLVMLRGVRDKLPPGRLSLVVSLQDRLGGRLLRWSALRGQEWGAATLPVVHNGRFSDADVRIDQSVFTACPSRPDIKPSMVMVFELYLLSGDASPVDRVVGWTAFPIADTNFNVLHGVFKAPILRGAVDARVDKFGKMEKHVAADLDGWLCNMYFEIVRLPRHVSGQREYEVALQFSSGLLGYPSRMVGTGAEDKLEAPPSAADRPLTSAAVLRKRLATAKPRARRTSEALMPREEEDDDAALGKEVAGPEIEVRPTDTPGVTYRLHTASVFDQYQRDIVLMLPQSRLGPPRRLGEQEQLDQHSYAVVGSTAVPGVTRSTARVKLQYVSRQLLAELGLAQIRSGEFWFSVLALMLMFWLRIYTHYFGQWVFLQGLKVPITDFTFEPISVSLNYQASALLAREEIGIVCLGPIFLIGVMVILCLLSYASQRLLGSFSSLASRFVCAWGMLTIVDPMLIALVDVAMQRWKNQTSGVVGDAFKLYWHFFRTDGSGLPGVFLTLFLYIVLMMTASVIFYIYFLRLHMDGRMMDAFQRLNGGDDDFFIPLDNELSHRELQQIVKKAEAWRGPKGERRKAAVYDHVWKQEGKGQEVTTHISIHTLSLDGSRTLFRQFLRLPDGALVEVRGAVGMSNMDGRMRRNLERAAVDLGGLLAGATAAVNRTMNTTGDMLRGDPGPSKRPTASSLGTSGPAVVLLHRTSLHGIETHA